MEEHPVLWHFTFSHFNEKARWALDYKGIRHVRHPLVPGFHASTVRKMTGQTAMPVLQMNGRTIHDSTRIIAALEETFPEPPLYPRAPAERARALELEEFFDEELGPHIRRVGFHLMLPDPGFVVAAFTSESGLAARIAMRVAFPMISVVMRKRMRIDEAGVEVSRKKTFAALDRLERELQPSGYLVGDRFSVADLTAAALCSPLVAPPEFPYLPRGPMPEPMARVRESVAARPGFRWVLEMYRRHRGRSAAIAA
ncbi:MAG: glutathione S-transferase [Deltaproteobacteria bacterium]|nr:MAG: glutathione S-transferase [Deltaproteobacteria bacterium]TMA53155.1 MAG: glutathione S-transferase [Deltaproteobacteria bacterium]